MELVLGKGPIQGLEHTLTAEKMYLICLSVVQKFTNLKENIQKLYQLHYASESFQKAWTDNMKKTGFNGYVYGFSVDYDATDVGNIKDIHEYFMKKNNSVNEDV